MSVIVIGDADRAALACNTSGQAFGPLHRSVDGNAARELRAFKSDLGADPRRLELAELMEQYREWCSREAARKEVEA